MKSLFLSTFARALFFFFKPWPEFRNESARLAFLPSGRSWPQAAEAGQGRRRRLLGHHVVSPPRRRVALALAPGQDAVRGTGWLSNTRRQAISPGPLRRHVTPALHPLLPSSSPRARGSWLPRMRTGEEGAPFWRERRVAPRARPLLLSACHSPQSPGWLAGVCPKKPRGPSPTAAGGFVRRCLAAASIFFLRAFGAPHSSSVSLTHGGHPMGGAD